MSTYILRHKLFVEDVYYFHIRGSPMELKNINILFRVRGEERQAAFSTIQYYESKNLVLTTLRTTSDFLEQNYIYEPDINRLKRIFLEFAACNKCDIALTHTILGELLFEEQISDEKITDSKSNLIKLLQEEVGHYKKPPRTITVKCYSFVFEKITCDSFAYEITKFSDFELIKHYCALFVTAPDSSILVISYFPNENYYTCFRYLNETRSSHLVDPNKYVLDFIEEILISTAKLDFRFLRSDKNLSSDLLIDHIRTYFW